MNEEKEYLTIKKSAGLRGMKGRFRSVEFEDNGHYIIYIPSLQVSAYGDNVTEAREMFKAVVEDFFDNMTLLDKSQINKELKKLGWESHGFFKKQYENSNTFIDREGILKNFNLSEDTKIQEKFVTV